MGEHRVGFSAVGRWRPTLLLAGRRLAHLIVAIPVALFVSPGASAAQGAAAIAGAVLDEAGLTPIEGATVVLQDGSSSVTTDADGRFALTDVPVGSVDVRVAAEGFGSLVERVDVLADEASIFQFQLRRVDAVLDGLLVDVLGPDARARGHAEGTIEAPTPDLQSAAAMLLNSVPGLSGRRPDGLAGTGVNIQLRGVSSFELSSQPQIFLDGARIDAGGVDGAIDVLDQIPASSVTRIRVLRGPASVSMYAQAAAGVILIETGDP